MKTHKITVENRVQTAFERSRYGLGDMMLMMHVSPDRLPDDLRAELEPTELYQAVRQVAGSMSVDQTVEVQQIDLPIVIDLNPQ